MKKSTFFYLIIFILIKTFLVLDLSWAVSFCFPVKRQNTYVLSPQIKLDSATLKSIFRNLISSDDKNQSESIGDNPVNMQNNNVDFKKYLIQKIEEKGGKITFAEFMNDALYHKEYGYYIKTVKIGKIKYKDGEEYKEGVTFDTYAQDKHFGRCVAEQLIEMWKKMGRSEKFSFVEMGAGNGTLAKNILNYIRENSPALFNSLEYVIVEISPKLRYEQEKNLQEFKNLVQWKQLSQLNEIEGVFLSNELPDAFPVHRIRIINGEPKDVYVAFNQGKDVFEDVIAELSTTELKEYMVDLMAKVKLPEGAEIAVNLNMRNWQKEIAKALKRGFVLTIDYGGKIEETLERHKQAIWNKDFKQMLDIYARTGEIDITSNVNFYDLANWGNELGLVPLGYTLQRDFLWDLGISALDIPDSFLFDINTNFNFKVLIQGKDIPEDISLTGLTSAKAMAEEIKRIKVMEKKPEKKIVTGPFMWLYDKEITLVLPISNRQSDFLIFADSDLLLPSKEKISRGLSEIKEHFENFGPVQTRCGVIEKINQKGNFIIDLKRSRLEAEGKLKLVDSKGEVIFENIYNYLRQNPEKTGDLALSYKGFEKKYLSNFDLTRPDLDKIPNIYYLHSDGTLSIYPETSEPDGIKEKDNQKLEQMLLIEQAI